MHTHQSPMTILDFPKRKALKQKISMITCYDATFASLIGDSCIDCVLVGDSCAMVIYGEKTTIPATVEMIARHTEGVRKGLGNTFLVSDMPFLSFRKGLGEATDAAGALLRAGANAVKIEGITGNEEIIHHLVNSGIPVMGHLGLTPQFYHTLGGYRVQGREKSAAERLKTQAAKMQEAGCFSLVLECVPEALAGEISRSLDIPVIGIGAGREVDGQVLVLYDLLGLTSFKSTFVRKYMDGNTLVQGALDRWCADIESGSFPSESEVFSS